MTVDVRGFRGWCWCCCCCLFALVPGAVQEGLPRICVLARDPTKARLELGQGTVDQRRAWLASVPCFVQVTDGISDYLPDSGLNSRSNLFRLFSYFSFFSPFSAFFLHASYRVRRPDKGLGVLDRGQGQRFARANPTPSFMQFGMRNCELRSCRKEGLFARKEFDAHSSRGNG